MRTLPALTLALTGLLAIPAHAAPHTAPDFATAAATARQKNIPVAVFVHGSSWHRASKIFGEKVWSSPEFAAALAHPVILTSIHIRQNPSKEQAGKDAAKTKGWNPKSVSTYPAVQVIAADGHLLKTYSGRELRVLTTPASLAQHLNHILAAAHTRRDLLVKTGRARAAGNTAEELEHLAALAGLPLNNEPKIIEQLRKTDPDDRSGWQARLSFKGWEFVRHITAMVNDGKTAEAVAECDRLLASSRHTPQQRALILGAKARALVAQGKLTGAWRLFQEAHHADPTGPNGKAMLAYGTRAAGVPLREVLPHDSALRGKPVGTNLTRGHATLTLSSAYRDDNPGDHPTLFAGSYARSGFAFHTAAQKDAHVIVDLKAPCQLRALRITNRSNLTERAATLAVWTSTDQKTWKKAWQAEKPRHAWDILLQSPVTARYIKIGLDSPHPQFLHLRAVDAFGTRP